MPLSGYADDRRTQGLPYLILIHNSIARISLITVVGKPWSDIIIQNAFLFTESYDALKSKNEQWICKLYSRETLRIYHKEKFWSVIYWLSRKPVWHLPTKDFWRGLRRQFWIGNNSKSYRENQYQHGNSICLSEWPPWLLSNSFPGHCTWRRYKRSFVPPTIDSCIETLHIVP